jgi:hypothetical protein
MEVPTGGPTSKTNSKYGTVESGIDESKAGFSSHNTANSLPG